MMIYYYSTKIEYLVKVVANYSNTYVQEPLHVRNYEIHDELPETDS